MGRVETIYPSRDGFSCVARVETKTGSLVRPIQKLYLLEVLEVGDPVLQIRPERWSRYGRLTTSESHASSLLNFSATQTALFTIHG
ncbi:hypothetical protein AVEN_72090-1 [Araneus ventricosus]|uniref:DUF5641 domain-containing protein n=1 Tax=Araneus ventricosus TaxID=182803 RepID=A0A4Y2S7P7_ARAVE|nr:hypothetical protein AVEN_72090-1 [Araneus ventricosus]